MKLLFISNISKGVGSFNLAAIKAAKSLGHEFHLAADFSGAEAAQLQRDEQEYGVKIHQIDFKRNPFHPANLKAYRQIVKVIRDEKIDAIHCNTPIGGIVGRLAGAKAKGIKVIYQAHGFHFYQGAPMVNWLLYFPVERFLAHLTDAIITINREDYKRARRFHLRRQGKVYFVPGVGIDVSEYEPGDFDREGKRAELGLDAEDVMVISAGDLIKRKNYATAIEAIARAKNVRMHYFICGKGPLREELERMSQSLGVESQVHFLGFRDDVKELLWASDAFMFTTLQEGLPRSLSEAMASGVPCIASRIRGNVDLIDNGRDGFLCKANDAEGFASALSRIADDRALLEKLGEAGREKIKKFGINAVVKAIKKVYVQELGGENNG